MTSVASARTASPVDARARQRSDRAGAAQPLLTVASEAGDGFRLLLPVRGGNVALADGDRRAGYDLDGRAGVLQARITPGYSGTAKLMQGGTLWGYLILRRYGRPGEQIRMRPAAGHSLQVRGRTVTVRKAKRPRTGAAGVGGVSQQQARLEALRELTLQTLAVYFAERLDKEGWNAGQRYQGAKQDMAQEVYGSFLRSVRAVRSSRSLAQLGAFRSRLVQQTELYRRTRNARGRFGDEFRQWALRRGDVDGDGKRATAGDLRLLRNHLFDLRERDSANRAQVVGVISRIRGELDDVHSAVAWFNEQAAMGKASMAMDSAKDKLRDTMTRFLNVYQHLDELNRLLSGNRLRLPAATVVEVGRMLRELNLQKLIPALLRRVCDKLVAFIANSGARQLEERKEKSYQRLRLVMGIVGAALSVVACFAGVGAWAVAVGVASAAGAAGAAGGAAMTALERSSAALASLSLVPIAAVDVGNIAVVTQRLVELSKGEGEPDAELGELGRNLLSTAHALKQKDGPIGEILKILDEFQFNSWVKTPILLDNRNFALRGVLVHSRYKGSDLSAGKSQFKVGGDYLPQRTQLAALINYAEQLRKSGKLREGEFYRMAGHPDFVGFTYGKLGRDAAGTNSRPNGDVVGTYGINLVRRWVQ